MGGFPACMIETTKSLDGSSLPIEFGAEGRSLQLTTSGGWRLSKGGVEVDKCDRIRPFEGCVSKVKSESTENGKLSPFSRSGSIVVPWDSS